MPVIYDEYPHPIRIARQKRGLTLYDLAQLTHISVAKLSKLESKKNIRIYVDQLVSIADALDLPWSELVTSLNKYLPKGEPRHE